MPSSIKTVAICGAGAMGSGIAQLAAQAGCTTLVFDMDAAALDRASKRVNEAISGLASRGKLPADAADNAIRNLKWTTEIADLAPADLVIEAIIEDQSVKQALYARIEDVTRPAAIIASNTSSLPISRLARGLKHPERFAGMHFFNPAQVMKLVEVIAGAATDPSVMATIKATAEEWGKVGVIVADVPGFIVNRVARPFYAEAFRALSENAAPPSLIDDFFRAAGFRMGPLELADLIGHDVNFSVAKSVYESYFGQTRFTPQLAQAALVDAGWLGRKTGRGIYRYDQPAEKPAGGAAATPAPCAYVKAAADAILRQLDGAESFTLVEADGVLVGLSRGRTALSESRDRGGASVGVIDWFDSRAPGSLAYAATSGAADAVASNVVAALGRTPQRVSDRPGLIVLRTLGQILNAAADAALEGVSDEQGIDSALQYGANYPFGLFAWADRIGRGRIAEILSNIASETGVVMYAPSQYLKATA